LRFYITFGTLPSTVVVQSLLCIQEIVTAGRSVHREQLVGRWLEPGEGSVIIILAGIDEPASV